MSEKNWWILVGVVGATVFLFQTFQTQGAARDFNDSVGARLSRIEAKVDDLLSRK
jgi:hypothetical protein